MTTILGFSRTLDSGAAVIDNCSIKAAVNEERLNRIKLYSGLPIKSIKESLSISKVKKVDAVVISGQIHGLPDINVYLKNLFVTSPKYYWYLLGRFKHVLHYRQKCYNEMHNFAKRKFPKAKLHSVEHHLAHAASTHYTSGKKNNLIVTIDAWGDKQSSAVYLGSETIEQIYSTPELYSVGYFYGSITGALGFVYHRHEGKVTGLAAYGEAKKALLDIMKKIIRFDSKTMSFKTKISRYYRPSGDGEHLKKLLGKYKREDVAAAAQRHLESVVADYITALIDKTGKNNLALAGGVFANVKLNQALNHINGVKSIFIHPHMGDGGLSMGASLWMQNAEFEPLNTEFDNLYFGPSYSEQSIKKGLKKNNLHFKYLKDIEYQIAELLAKGKVVARFDGRMEYGPRALGNRSVLYQTTDKSVNDWLNKYLKRSEFMPFAPATLARFVKKCYVDYKGAEYAAKFMTITFDCTDWMKQTCPGVVHVDGTARPQIVDEKSNPSYCKIIDEYRKITGIPSIINTSFNMHEEPIVCTPYDAIRAFKLGHLDYLAIGNYLVKSNE